LKVIKTELLLLYGYYKINMQLNVAFCQYKKYFQFKKKLHKTKLRIKKILLKKKKDNNMNK